MRQLEAMEPGAVLKKIARCFGLAENQLTGKRTGHRDQRGYGARAYVSLLWGKSGAHWQAGGRIGLHDSESGAKAATGTFRGGQASYQDLVGDRSIYSVVGKDLPPLPLD